MKRMLQQKQREQPSQWHSLSTPLLALLIVVCTTTIFSCFQSSVDAFTTTPTHNALHYHHHQHQLAKTNAKKNPLSSVSTASSIKNYQHDETMLMSRPNRVTSLSFKDDKSGYDEEDPTIMKQDWNAIATTAGNLIQNVGSKVFYFAGWLVSRLLHIISENVNKLKDKILTPTITTTAAPTAPSSATATKVNDETIIIDVDDEEDDDRNSYYSKLVEETANQDDADLFRSILGLHKKKGNNGNDDANHSMIDRVLNQAVSLLEQDEMATYLLGTIGTTSSLKYSQPFSHRSEIANNNDGKTTTQRTIHLRFEVIGNYGRKGIASIMSNDDTIVLLDLEIDGRMHRVKTTATPKSSFRTSPQQSSSSSSSPKVQIENTQLNEDTNNYVDVEIMKGVYWPTVASLRDENIIDAEIEDKEFF